MCVKAIQVHRDCLKRYPKLVWALVGLQRSLEQSIKSSDPASEQAIAHAAELEEITAAAADALKQADVELTVSCFCAQQDLQHDALSDDGKRRKIDHECCHAVNE